MTLLKLLRDNTRLHDLYAALHIFKIRRGMRFIQLTRLCHIIIVFSDLKIISYNSEIGLISSICLWEIYPLIYPLQVFCLVNGTNELNLQLA